MITADMIADRLRSFLTERKLYIVRPERPTMGEIALEHYGIQRACDAVAYQGNELDALLMEIAAEILNTRGAK